LKRTNQHGGTDYVSEALYTPEFGDKYDYQLAISQGKTWAMLNPEQQAHLIGEAYLAGYFQNGKWTVPKSNPPVIDTILTNFMTQVLPQLRSGQGAT
jgi:hypothetical protein